MLNYDIKWPSTENVKAIFCYLPSNGTWFYKSSLYAICGFLFYVFVKFLKKYVIENKHIHIQAILHLQAYYDSLDFLS